LRRGKHAIKGAKEAITLLRNKSIPIFLITNAGGQPEQSRADLTSNIIGLEENHKFSKNEIFLCHTPMRPELKKYKDEIILITGVGVLDILMKEYEVEKYITTDEYADIYPEMFPYFFITSNAG
jgi:ribonucleotide monophosphatase NagD (HAD superfamily)